MEISFDPSGYMRNYRDGTLLSVFDHEINPAADEISSPLPCICSSIRRMSAD